MKIKLFTGTCSFMYDLSINYRKGDVSKYDKLRAYFKTVFFQGMVSDVTAITAHKITSNYSKTSPWSTMLTVEKKNSKKRSWGWLGGVVQKLKIYLLWLKQNYCTIDKLYVYKGTYIRIYKVYSPWCIAVTWGKVVIGCSIWHPACT